ncbi:MAG: bacterial Ig-like domain-containing protein, partial [Acutalibacteraceae bacterium]|nr:bacterial Ig-like domain-containing protein [Acutalibacteraceae bacterium]
PTYVEKDIAVTVTAEDAEIFAGSTTNVTATFEPNEPEISAVEWTTSNNAIATVNSDGVVTGVAQGTATITGTITYDGRTYSATTSVKVNPVEVTAIAVNTMPDKTTLYTGDEFDPTGLTLTVTYNNGTTAVVSEGMTFNAVNTTYAGTKTVRVTYGGKTTTFRVTVVELAVESIEITKLPDTTEYFFGDEELDTTGIVVEAVYNNGEREVIDEGELYFEGFDASAPGEVEIVVYYEDFEASFNITVKALDVTKLAIKTMPKKTSYFTGETADYTGLTLTATYSNGVTTTVTEGYTVTGFDSTTVGTKTLTVEYEGKTVTFDVTVKAIELVSIEIVTPAEKTEYFVGDAADYTGLTVKATYNNGTTEMIEDYTVTGFDSMTAGQKTITVEYNGKTATYNVTVKVIELVSIEIVTPAEKTEYFVGDAADYTGLTVKATYNNGTTAMIEDYTVTGFDSMTAGQKTITVEYNGKTAAYNVTVKAIELVSLVIATNPAKTTYYTNEVFDATGLTLTATYNNGTTAEITEGFVVGAVDMTTEGTKNVTVTYEGKTVSFNITVNALYITNVEINTMPDKTEYMIGEAEDNTGLTLKVTYNDGSTKVVNDGFTVFGFDSSVKGEVTMMVEYVGYYLTYDVTIIGKADFSKVDALLAEFKAEDPLKYTNYDEINLVYVYDFENTTLPLAKKAYTSEKDQAEVDALYNELKGYYDMLEPIPDEPVIVERFEIVGGAKVVKQSGVNYIVGLQPSLTKAKFQSTYADYENVTLVFNMTTARYMGTGSTLTVKSTATGEVIAEYVIVIYGDVDGSATINGRDAAAVSNSITGVADSLTGAAKLAANVEGARATINAKDASVIRAVAGGSMTIDQSTGKGVEI